jgi:hypothetical protein
LNKGAVHDVQVAARADQLISAKKKDIGEIYDTIEKDLANKEITLKNPQDAQELKENLMKLIRSGESNSPEALKALNNLENVGKAETVKARDYLATFRTIRDYAHEARKEAYKSWHY